MSSVLLARRKSTVLWDGDVIVAGAGWAGFNAALTAARAGKRTCLLEPGPALGFELSQLWLNHLPFGPLPDRVREFCAGQGAQRNDRADLVIGALAFDRLAEDAGLFSIVRVLPMRPLADSKGILAGVEIVGKSGRQIVQAPVVIDAMPGRRFSRRVVGQRLPEIRLVERRLYVYGVVCPAGEQRIGVPSELGLAGNAVAVLPTVWPWEAILSLAMEVSPAASRADMYLKTLTSALAVIKHLRASAPAFSAATPVGIAPAVRDMNPADPVDDQALADTGLYPLPQAETPEREMELAEQMAQAAAGSDRRRKKLPRRDKSDAGERLKTAELSAAFDGGFARGMLAEVGAERHEPCDVVVAGCGPGGSLAALAAAGQKARVAVLTLEPLYGGIGTAGHIHSYYHGLTGGLQDGLEPRIADESAAVGFNGSGFHPMAKAEILANALAEAQVAMWAGHIVFGVLKSGHQVQGVLAADENGYHVFPCATAIDATGDGDLAAAGARFTLGRSGDGFPQPYSYTPAMIKNGKLSHRNFDAGWVDPTDTLDYSRAHFEGRRKIEAQGPFSETQHYCALPSELGVRESRLIRGKITLGFEDILTGRAYPDTVCSSYAHYDNHAMDYAAESDWARRYVVMFGLWQYLCRGDIPYRALLPAGIEGLLIACRALSVDHDLHQLVRMQRDMQTIGEVCGVAAALAAKQGIMPSQVDIIGLRRLLQERGLLPEQPPAPALKKSARDLLKSLGTEQNGLAMWRLRILSMRAKPPHWDAFFAGEHDPNRRFCAAVTVSVSGVRHEACRQELYRVLRDRVEGPRLGVKSPARFVVAALALAEMKDPDIAGEIGRLLEDPALDPPTLVLLLKALEQTGPRGIQPIRSFLEQNAHREFLFSLWGCDPTWTTSLRFVIELQAVSSLHVLGCREEDNRLQRYLSHPNLLVRRYALKLDSKG